MKAIEYATASLDAVLILGKTFAVVYAEPEKKGCDKYLLSER